MSEKEFLDFENSKGVEKEVRAIHFDLGIKQIDANYEYRSKPYSEINKAMYELGFHRQQGSGYISNTDLTPDEFIYTIQKLKEKVPKLEKVVKHIDATYLKDVWDMKPFVSGNLKGTGMCGVAAFEYALREHSEDVCGHADCHGRGCQPVP